MFGLLQHVNTLKISLRNRIVIKYQIFFFNHFQIDQGEEKYSDRVAGRVRLTSYGTTYFENFLNDTYRKDFYMKLKKELADAIPISPDRITTNENAETDTSIPLGLPKQIFLSINI